MRACSAYFVYSKDRGEWVGVGRPLLVAIEMKWQSESETMAATRLNCRHMASHTHIHAFGDCSFTASHKPVVSCHAFLTNMGVIGKNHGDISYCEWCTNLWQTKLCAKLCIFYHGIREERRNMLIFNVVAKHRICNILCMCECVTRSRAHAVYQQQSVEYATRI